MPQKTNLNISPYYDDFDKDKDFYKVLFKPGFPIQARELTTLQSMLQNQVEQFGSHIFKDGAMVIPGGVTFDVEYHSVKVDPLHLGLDITLYLDSIIENRTILRGRNSDITCSVEGYLTPSSGLVNDFTIFVRYLSSGTNNISSSFPDSEVLLLESSVTYQNTTLNSTDSVITVLSSNATAVGSAAHIEEGIYFIRGTFTQVSKDTIVLDPYSNTPSYRVGLTVNETIISANEDETLNDNAKGFTNYAAPGADRFKIDTRLAKKELDDNEDINFIELLRVIDGKLLKVQNTDVYNIIKDYFAKRTYDESGDYTLDNLNVIVNNSLNDGERNTPVGLYKTGSLTGQGNEPSDDLATITVAPGTAYVKGFDVELVGQTAIDVEKPREIKKVSKAVVPFNMGSLLKVNNVFGAPFIDIGDVPGGDSSINYIELHNERKSGGTSPGSVIGRARVYWYGVSDAPYTGASTEWDLYLFDVQTYSDITVGSNITEANVGSRVRGATSGATGYIAEFKLGVLSNPQITQTSGKFILGESLIFDENPINNKTITDVTNYTIEDVKSVFQDTPVLNPAIPQEFVADTVLYNKTPKSFSPIDTITVNGSSVTAAGKFFSEEDGFKVGSIIKYQESGESDLSYSKITAISSDATTLTITTVPNVSGVAKGSPLPGGAINVTFALGVAKIFNYENRGIYAPLPDTDIESVDLSSSTLTVSKQSFGALTNGSGVLTRSISDYIDLSTGITNVFFAPYDAERYSVHYSNGDTALLTSEQVEISNNGNTLTIYGLNTSETNVTVSATLTKASITSKSKIYTRSKKLSVDKSKVDTSHLTLSTAYGLRVEDEVISLNVPDVANVLAIYESPNNSSPTLPRVRFITGSNIDSAVVVGERIVGKDSKAVAQLVTAVSGTIAEIVYLGSEEFIPTEQVEFQESGVKLTPIELIPGSFIDRTDNYDLDKGHREQFADYSRIVRKASANPSRELLIVFDFYKVNTTDNASSGDIFTASSYGRERFTYDVPTVSPNNLTRLSDTIDFRPRVKEYSGSVSPFAFSSRQFESTFNFTISPDEACILGYNTYLARADRLVIDKKGNVRVIKGSPSKNPQLPEIENDTMEVAQITYPPYLYRPSDAFVRILETRRYTMRDIGRLEDKISTLEEFSTLSLLEVSTQTLQVSDAFGLNKFKSGFVAANFSDTSFLDLKDIECKIDIDTFKGALRSAVDFWSIAGGLAFSPSIDTNTADLNANLKLLDQSIKKTGDILTLDYTEVVMINQPHATRVENVNPFNVIAFVGGVKLDPPSDNWTRTIYKNNEKIESTGNTWAQTGTDKKATYTVNGYKKQYTYQETTTTYKTELQGTTPQIKFVEDVKITSEVDPYMRERNVFFAANGLKPFTKHYYTLDTQSVDILPKIVEISMTSGTFQVGEKVEIIQNGKKIGISKLQKPNHKFGGTGATSNIGEDLGTPSVLDEVYTIDIFDKTRPAPVANYSATSALLNFDVSKTAASNDLFGYVTVGCKVIGQTSNAVAEVTKTDLISDNWGDILGAMYFQNPQKSPTPSTLVTTGTKSVKLDANTPGTVVLPGSSNQSNSVGTYSGTGTVLTQTTSFVQLRNPPKPKTKQSEVKTELLKVTHRDPLAQTFTTDGEGAYLTSFDVFFAKKDPNAKLFVELRTVELGTPTQYLVQDFAQLEINPQYINIPDDPFEPVPTNFKFESPIYLQPDTEYALVFLAPSSDNYEMYTARMGEKTLSTTNLPDVENVVVSKQYIGGSLFKSQNGTIWTPNQFDDLTFKLYKAKFAKTGTTYFYNTPILPDGDNSATLVTNPIETFPRKMVLPLSSTNGVTQLQPGTTLSETTSITKGVIENVGRPLNVNPTISNAGIGYDNGTVTVDLFSIDGYGSGAQINVTFSSNKVFSINSIASNGTGYVTGETLGIVTGTAIGNKGTGAVFTIDTNTGDIDTAYMTNVDGQKFSTGATISFISGGTETATAATVTSDSTILSPLYEGNVFKVTQYNHGHHSPDNKVKIIQAYPSRESTTIAQELGLNDTVVTVASTTPFSTFEGITTSAGYALIENEILEYSSVGEGSITINARGVDNSIPSTHSNGTKIVPYEINGVSLRRINTTYDSVPDTVNNYTSLDNYYLTFDRSANGTYRDNVGNLLNFTSNSSVGGNSTKISQNYQFSVITPEFNNITPGDTSIVASLRTITGKSAGGEETPFLDAGFENVVLNSAKFYPEPRMVASLINETDKLTSILGQSSLTLRLDFATNNENISPAIDVKNSTFTFGRSRLNNPIENYAGNTAITKGDGSDPHASSFVSKEVLLQKPATSLKVFVSANRKDTCDFRVLYKLVSADSSEVDKNYRLFPGYDNLKDTDGDGVGDTIIDPNKNSGLPDTFVTTNVGEEYSEYEFTADNLEEFTGFKLKIVFSSTNESNPVLISDIRALALS